MISSSKIRSLRGAPGSIYYFRMSTSQCHVRQSLIVETIKRYFRVDRRKIAFVKFILEAHDGIAVLETLDPQAGNILLHIAPGCEEDVAAILQDLKKDILIEKIDGDNYLATNLHE